LRYSKRIGGYNHIVKVRKGESKIQDKSEEGTSGSRMLSAARINSQETGRKEARRQKRRWINLRKVAQPRASGSASERPGPTRGSHKKKVTQVYKKGRTTLGKFVCKGGLSVPNSAGIRSPQKGGSLERTSLGTWPSGKDIVEGDKGLLGVLFLFDLT